MFRPLSRRDFLRFVTSSAAAVSLHGFAGKAFSQYSSSSEPRNEPGRIVRVVHAGAMSNPSHVNCDPNGEVVEVMLDAALMAFTGRGDIAEAWREFVTPSDRVLIKIDCYGAPNMATNEAVVHGVVRGLQAAGVPAENTVIFDLYQSRMARAHFRVGHPIMGATVEYAGTRGFSPDPTAHPSGLARFARAFADATAVVNLPVVKDHVSCGVAIAMRNTTHGVVEGPGDSADRGCSPSIADLFQTEVVREKTRVIIADGLRVMFDGGPDDTPSKVLENQLLIGTDPVAIDTVGLDLIDRVRLEHGLASLEEDGRDCGWLQAAQDYGLGIHDRERITLETHHLG